MCPHCPLWNYYLGVTTILPQGGTQEELIEKLGGIEGANQTKRPDGSTSTTLPDGRRVDTYPGRTSTQKPGWQIIKPGRRKPTHKGQTQ